MSVGSILCKMRYHNNYLSDIPLPLDYNLEAKEYPTNNKEKANLYGQMLHRNCFLNHVIKRNIEGKEEGREDEK